VAGEAPGQRAIEREERELDARGAAIDDQELVDVCLEREVAGQRSVRPTLGAGAPPRRG